MFTPIVFCALPFLMFVTAIPSRYAEEQPIAGLENVSDVSEGSPAENLSATTENVVSRTTGNASPTTRRQPWSKLGRGFFGGQIRNRPPDKKGAKDKNVKDNVCGKRKADVPPKTKSRVHGLSSRTLFGTSTECSAANPGRPCVCYVPDFLDKIGDKLEDIYDATDERSVTAKVVALRCTSYRALPESFVIDASPVPKDRVTLGATDVQVPELAGQNVTVGVSKEVNFENDVIKHYMEKSTNGKKPGFKKPTSF